jgi:hypothetical protein
MNTQWMRGKRTISRAAGMATVIVALASLAGAQPNETRSGWGSTSTTSELNLSRSSSTTVSSNAMGSALASAVATDTCGAQIRKGANIYSPLVGSWLNTVTITPASGGPSRQFTTMETFNVGGTMIDEADGPGNLQSIGLGAWAGGASSSAASFQLFQYDPVGNVVGRIRVRGSFRVNRQDQLIAPRMTVDFIAPDGSVFCGVATATATGTRISALTP